MSLFPRIPLKNSIATKLLTLVFSIYFLVTLTLTVMHMITEYSNMKQSILEDLNVIFETFESGVSLAIWHMDDTQLAGLASGMTRLQNIVGVEIFDDRGKLLYATENFDGNAKKKQIFEHFGKSYTVVGKGEQLGTIKLYSSNRVVLDKVKLGFLLIVINSILKTAALWLIFLWVSRIILNRPLNKLTSAIENSNWDNIGSTQIDIGTTGDNELKVIEGAFNVMTKKLDQAKQRATSLRRFSNKIGNFSDSSQTFQHVFHEACEHIQADNIVHFFDHQKDHFSNHRYFRHGHEFLIHSPSLSTLGSPFLWKNEASIPDQEVVVFNSIEAQSELALFFKDHGKLDLKNHKLLFLIYRGYSPHLVVLYRNESYSNFDDTDIEYAKSLMTETRIAENNIQMIKKNTRMESELKTAAVVQKLLFPKGLPSVQALDFANFFRSAAETGGDWHGFMTQFEDSIFILIGDVTGHGIPAALVTATASATCGTMEKIFLFDQDSMGKLSPATCLKHLNSAIFDAGAPDFLMTFFIAQIDLCSGMMKFSSAGHNFPIVVRSSGEIEHALNTNHRLGYRTDRDFTEDELQLKEGDTIVFYTDGLTENQNPKEAMWGEARLLRHLKKIHQLPAEEIVESTVNKALHFYDGHPIEDDITLLVCKVKEPFVQTGHSV